ncbi:unnamed protein product [Schistosoma curassoni]|uniref:Uncharacterized protein n=1 Tax=Schistosoma curassoni TaxID=6186 RepID=A0A183JL66_9TREM|nr:unnamed protein product [Schistosoma curassoni]
MNEVIPRQCRIPTSTYLVQHVPYYRSPNLQLLHFQIVKINYHEVA